MALIAETPHLDQPAIRGPRYTRQRRFVPILVTLFLLSVLAPISFSIGSVLLNPYRVVLLLAFFPTFLRWINRKAGPILLPDVLLLCFALWASMTFAIAHGVTEAIEPSGAHPARNVWRLSARPRLYPRHVEFSIAVTFALSDCGRDDSVCDGRSPLPPDRSFLTYSAPSQTCLIKSPRGRAGVSTARKWFSSIPFSMAYFVPLLWG